MGRRLIGRGKRPYVPHKRTKERAALKKEKNKRLIEIGSASIEHRSYSEPLPNEKGEIVVKESLCINKSSRNVWELNLDSREFVKHESSETPKEAIINVNNIAVPVFTEEMTKKDLVNDTLKWMYEVFGSEHFDCDGRRGPNVLRLKVKTRGALEHICPLIDRLVNEELVHHISCPISTKKSRQHIRGYLAYIEAVSGEAIDRIMEIFNKYNEILIHDCDGQLEHPFKGLSRNPKKQEQKA